MACFVLIQLKWLTEHKTKLKYVSFRDVGSCSHCAVKLQGPPTVLPCGHRLCDKCYMQEARPNHQCPDCHQQVPADFLPETSDCYDK